MRNLLLYLTTSLFFGISCGPLPAPGGGQSDAPQSTEEYVESFIQGVSELSVEFQELSRPSRVQVWVDNLIVKAQPGKDMPQVAMMKEGEMATYLKQRTVRKAEFKLRNQRYYEPWILIITKDSIMGWVFEGGVRYIENDLISLLTGGQNTNGTNATQRTRGMDAGPSPVQNEMIDWQIVPGKRLGPIQVGTSEEALARTYGPGNVGKSTVVTTGSKTEACTVLMPGSNNELRITWKDENRNRIKAIYLDKPNSRWLSAQGLKVGMGLFDLTKTNKSPLSFYGFGWEYSGTISSFRNGLLHPYEKYFYAVLQPRNEKAVQGMLKNFQGDKVFSSNDEGIEQLDLIVSRMVIYLD